MYTFNKTIHLHDTDAAGRLYFAHIFRIAHEAYEAFMVSLGFPVGTILKAGKFGLPIVHAEADYKAALRMGDEITVEVKPIRIGQSSFSLLSRFTCAGRTMGRVTTVHVAVNAKRGTKCPLPARLRSALLKATR